MRSIRSAYPNRVAILSDGDSISYEELTEQHWTGPKGSVLVCCSSIINFTKAVVSLDSVVDSICVVNPTMSIQDLQHIINNQHFDCILTDLDSTHTILSMCKEASINPISIELLTDNIVKLAELFASPMNLSGKITSWLIPTSGTTAAPKLIKHTIYSLAKASISSAYISPSSTVWGLFYDVTRFAGYQVFFKALLSGDCISYSSSTQHRIQTCIKDDVSKISATATQWRVILMSPLCDLLKLTHITIGGEAVDQQVLNALSKRFPKSKITHVYASTEAGVVMSVSDCIAGFPISFLSDSIYIRDNLLYVDGISTGDIVEVLSDRLYIVGRENGVINVAGDKVVPEKIRTILLEHSAVQEALVYGKKNPFIGQLVVADIKLAYEVPKEEINKFLKQRLKSFEIPKIVNFVEDIEVSVTGKLIGKTTYGI